MTALPRPKIHEQVKSPTEIAFGKHFSDHMLLCHWDKDDGWDRPRIVPYGDIPLSPALSALHYATEVRRRICILTCTLYILDIIHAHNYALSFSLSLSLSLSFSPPSLSLYPLSHTYTCTVIHLHREYIRDLHVHVYTHKTHYAYTFMHI